MAIKSSNTEGNPYHDESTGEFTSGDESSSKKEQQAKEKLEHPEIPDGPTAPKISKFRLKPNFSSADIKKAIKEANQVSSIPFLNSAKDVEENFDKFFTARIVKQLDENFGKYPDAPDYKLFNLRTDPNKRCGVNLFAAIIGKKRYKNNYMTELEYNDFYNLLNKSGTRRLYRGLRGDYDTCKTIAESYCSIENNMIYGSAGGTYYGIAVYSSSSRSTAQSYSSGYIMDMILDSRDSHYMSYYDICNIRSELCSNRSELEKRAEQIFIKHGVEPQKAARMSKSFGYTLNDEGFVAILLGVDWYSSDDYHMIENLGKVYKLKK